jgi:hypothetical protein
MGEQVVEDYVAAPDAEGASDGAAAAVLTPEAA